MNETYTQARLPPFIKWGNYSSKDPSKPDVLELRVLDPEPFETQFSTNARVQEKEGQNWNDAILPLKSHTSNNASLLSQWTELIKKGRIKSGQQLKLKSWLGVTKNTVRPIRRFTIHIG